MLTIEQAVIFAGGRGIRLRPLTLSTPKPMIKIHGKPFLAYLVDLLRENGIKEIIILVGYLHDQIMNYFGDGTSLGISIRYSYDPIETDTGLRIKHALPLLKDHFLLMYGDNYWPLQLPELIRFYEAMGKKAMVTVYQNEDRITRNNMLIKDGLVIAYDRSRREPKLNGVDIGFFIIDTCILKNLPERNFSFEETVIAGLIDEKQLAGFFTKHAYYGLSTHERIPLIQEYFGRLLKTYDNF